MPHDDTVTVIDLFCGAGGSALGASVVPGVQLTMAANHWQLAIDTHAENFPDTDHDCADISQVDPRRYRSSTVLWASPECTNHSQAKGRRRDADTQPDLFGQTLPDEAAIRSRATMYDVLRFTEHHRYQAVIVENVVDAAKWIGWRGWLQVMDDLGYDHRVVYLNSMHAPAIAAPRAPQSRDRLYVVFWRKGNRAPDLDIRPQAWCGHCDRLVGAVQWFKRPDRRWGRYRQQYLYRCPHYDCRQVVEPYAAPAAAAIDWSIPGQRIGDRDKPLRPATIARIEAGLARYARPMTFEAHGNTYVRPHSGYARAWPVDWPTATLTTTQTRALLVPAGGTWNGAAASVSDPMRTRTTRETEALVVPVEGRDGKLAQPVEAPLRTQTARAETALVVPYRRTSQAHDAAEPMPTMTTVDPVGVAFIAELRGGGSDAREVTEPLATVTAAGNHHMLVRNNGTRERGDGMMCTPVDEPARTITTGGHQSLVGWDDEPLAVADCTFRMLEPAEIGRAMAFRDDYRVLGNRREKVRQYGNAVTPSAAEVLIRAVVESLQPT